MARLSPRLVDLPPISISVFPLPLPPPPLDIVSTCLALPESFVAKLVCLSLALSCPLPLDSFAEISDSSSDLREHVIDFTKSTFSLREDSAATCVLESESPLPLPPSPLSPRATCLAIDNT